MKTEIKTGLIMEGGAMRGMFTCGVIDVLMQNDITVDGAIGISAGAVFGCNFKSRQVGRAIRYYKKYGSDPRYSSIRSLLRTGNLYGVDFCYRELPDELDIFDRKTYRENPMHFYVGATDVETGQCVYHECMDGDTEDMLWFRASASMPMVSKPVEVGKRLLLDGGITDSVPYLYMEELGYHRNIIVLTQPDGYRKKPMSFLPLARLLLRKYPEVVNAMAVRHEMYNRQMGEIKQRESSGDTLVIRPPQDLQISRTEKNAEELERVYQIGVREAEKRIPEIVDFLKKR